jgi:hypothetical protein
MENRIDHFCCTTEDELVALKEDGTPRPVVLQLHVAAAELRCRPMPDDPREVTSSRHILLFGIPLLTGTSANEMMADEDVRALAWEIVQGYEVRNHVVTYTEAAEEAIERLRDLVHEFRGRQIAVETAKSYWDDIRGHLLTSLRSSVLYPNELRGFLGAVQDAEAGSYLYLTGVEEYAAGLLAEAGLPTTAE